MSLESLTVIVWTFNYHQQQIVTSFKGPLEDDSSNLDMRKTCEKNGKGSSLKQFFWSFWNSKKKFADRSQKRIWGQIFIFLFGAENKWKKPKFCGSRFDGEDEFVFSFFGNCRNCQMALSRLGCTVYHNFLFRDINWSTGVNLTYITLCHWPRIHCLHSLLLLVK